LKPLDLVVVVSTMIGLPTENSLVKHFGVRRWDATHHIFHLATKTHPRVDIKKHLKGELEMFLLKVRDV